jgi:hypothetical protein
MLDGEKDNFQDGVVTWEVSLGSQHMARTEECLRLDGSLSSEQRDPIGGVNQPEARVAACVEPFLLGAGKERSHRRLQDREGAGWDEVC